MDDPRNLMAKALSSFGSVLGPQNSVHPSYIMEPNLQETQSQQMPLPQGLMQDDSGRYFYQDNPSQTVPMVKRPGILPLANTPEGIKLVAPKALDLIGSLMGNIGGAASVPAKAGEMVLGSGPIKTSVEAKQATRMFHGSPTAGIKDFAGEYTFLTPKENVARNYATQPIMGSQKDLGGQKSPTVYHVDVEPKNTLDFTNPEHRNLYEKIRNEYNSSSKDPDDFLPGLKSEGFIQHNGYPGFGHATKILNLAEKHGFDSMHVQEAAEHGVSLLVKSALAKIAEAKAANPGTYINPQEAAKALQNKGLFPESYLDKVPTEQRLSLKGVSHPGYRFEVYDPKTGKVERGLSESKPQASRRVDRLDNKYGGYRYKTRMVPAVDLYPHEEEFLKANGLFDAVRGSDQGNSQGLVKALLNPKQK